MEYEISTGHNALERMLIDGSAEPMDLPLSLLQDITNCFSDDQQIGSGGFAVVYKGMVGNEIVAVKRLSRNMHESKFHKEVECLMKAKHKNIVRFLGYCSDTQGKIMDYEGKMVMADIRNWLLCFEYVPNGSLDKYITDASHGLEWRERFEIIKGTCDGLCHLHEKRILHLDLKPANILIDDHMVPKIADFGLTRCLEKEQTHVFTSNLCGSLGYLAPEFYSGQVTFASDIYSLGVIILEIMTGQKGYSEDKNGLARSTIRPTVCTESVPPEGNTSLRPQGSHSNTTLGYTENYTRRGGPEGIT
ncbi:cysteine-rich receptor-like protein kinase 26 isoform X1 [Triticum urartu]|uniref:cysteine-rich receptor-like protein kinase 26 isoform X1 n=1 Tax=Triticum urartu TaxID=4572 RepID=UPI002042FE0A|nr:cysteine-rich receptor-like protein kinase 26 isoform X1 [Triticum urartu]